MASSCLRLSVVNQVKQIGAGAAAYDPGVAVVERGVVDDAGIRPSAALVAMVQKTLRPSGQTCSLRSRMRLATRVPSGMRAMVGQAKVAEKSSGRLAMAPCLASILRPFRKRRQIAQLFPDSSLAGSERIPRPIVGFCILRRRMPSSAA